MKGDQGERICAESGRVLKAQIEIQLGLFPFAIVPLLAGNLTCATADALGDVDQRGLDGVSAASCVMIFSFSTLDTSAEGPCALTTLTRQAFVS